MAFTQEDKDKMDMAAADAEGDIEDSPEMVGSMSRVAGWWKKWYPKAGHKRLARILLQYAPKE